ncbi:uncharacterized protein SETTUDRAFT_34233 [Exserohilum turcica Et28A]|uniref:Uncharacterized protein n=1 Tax=Exserohilum turcicum (strain 28A) TaxID=671987 RepID=R0JNC4_EXST2|nr:uncharacterized protein SETTUDRAFT_34233 [Exserohilum turcica Et28A]EOA82693.1 hypothetical protein SETTUDRAFT_34233 [Exserohilum turcica Et28A]
MHALAVAEVSHQAKLVKVEEGAEMAGPRMWAHNVVATTSIVVLYMHVLIFSRRHKEYPARLRCDVPERAAQHFNRLGTHRFASRRTYQRFAFADWGPLISAETTHDTTTPPLRKTNPPTSPSAVPPFDRPLQPPAPPASILGAYENFREINDLWEAKFGIDKNGAVDLTPVQWATIFEGNRYPYFIPAPVGLDILALAGHLSKALNLGEGLLPAIAKNSLPIIQKRAALEPDRGCLATFMKFQITAFLNKRVVVKLKGEDLCR